ncbi:MAG: BACON domain-containing protein [Rikenellaceae bacterium]
MSLKRAISLSVLAVALLGGCKSSDGVDATISEEADTTVVAPSPSLEVSTSTLEFDADGIASQSSGGVVDITANCDWQVTLSSAAAESEWGWSISPQSGSGSGTIEVALPVSYISRVATITISATDDTSLYHEVTVTQTERALDEDVEEKDEVVDDNVVVGSNIAELFVADNDSQFTLRNVVVDYLYSAGIYVSSGDTTVLVSATSLVSVLSVGDLVTLTGTVCEYSATKSLGYTVVVESVESGTSTIVAKELAVANLADNIDQYVCLKAVTIDDTQVTLDGASITYFNKFGIADVVTSGMADIYGYVAAYGGVAQIYPTKFENIVESVTIVDDGIINVAEVALYLNALRYLTEASSNYPLNGLSYTEGDVTISFDKGTSNYMRLWNADGTLEFRFYTGNIVTFESSGAEIKSIAFDVSSGYALDEASSTATKWVYTFSATTKPKSIIVKLLDDDDDSSSSSVIEVDGQINVAEVVESLGVAPYLVEASSYYALHGLSYTEGDLTLSFDKGTSNYMRLWNASGTLEFRFYNGNILTFESSGKAIANITFDVTSSGYALDEQSSTATKWVYNFTATTKPKVMTVTFVE